MLHIENRWLMAARLQTDPSLRKAFAQDDRGGMDRSFASQSLPRRLFGAFAQDDRESSGATGREAINLTKNLTTNDNPKI
jgi:hypothetical protein